MWFLFIFYSLQLLQSQPEEISYLTTADKISLDFVNGGATLATIADPGDRFIMNAQMFRKPGYAPVGLYVSKRKIKNKLRLVNNPSVNFGIQPQAVFFIDTSNKAGIVDAKKSNPSSYEWATQIAPMLVMNGEVNPNIKSFRGKCSRRNGIGITKDGSVLFLLAISSTSLPEFAEMFIKKDCVSAAYVDGSVSDYWKPGMDAYRSFGIVVKSK